MHMARAPAVLLPLAFIRLILHHQMDRAQLKGLGKGQDIGILSNKLFLGVSQCFLNGGPGFKAHPSGIARFLGAAQIDGGGIHFRYMAAANHGEAVKWVERIAVTVFSDIFLIGCKVFAVPVHVRQGVHKIMLEHIIHFPGVRPQLIVEITVAQGGTDNHTVIAHNSLMPDNLRRNSPK